MCPRGGAPPTETFPLSLKFSHLEGMGGDPLWCRPPTDRGDSCIMADTPLWRFFAMQDRPMLAVLVVEDDPLVRTLAVEIVEEAGYVALEAADADEAVAILEVRSDIAVLFTDINMPGSIDGLKLAHAVRDRWPPIKIVMVSGKVELSANDMPPNSRFFAKPYQASKMVSELRSLITASEL
jgi:two-component system, response regulator PdtaR